MTILFSNLSTEEIAGGQYKIENLNISLETDGEESEMFLPRINKFIPTNFDLEIGEEQSWSVPKKINDTENGEVWFKETIFFYNV